MMNSAVQDLNYLNINFEFTSLNKQISQPLSVNFLQTKR